MTLKRFETFLSIFLLLVVIAQNPHYLYYHSYFHVSVTPMIVLKYASEPKTSRTPLLM